MGELLGVNVTYWCWAIAVGVGLGWSVDILRDIRDEIRGLRHDHADRKREGRDQI